MFRKTRVLSAFLAFGGQKCQRSRNKPATSLRIGKDFTKSPRQPYSSPNAFNGIEPQVSDGNLVAPELERPSPQTSPGGGFFLSPSGEPEGSRIAVQAVVDKDFHRGAVDVDVHREGKARGVLRGIELAVQGVAVEVVVDDAVAVDAEACAGGVGEVEGGSKME